MPEKKRRAEPIRQSVRVDCPIDEAFQLFTDEFAAWWPLAEYSVTREDAESCIIEPWVGGRVFERSRTGEECDWGSVAAWDPPRRLSITWDPGGTGEDSQMVDIEFERQADGTRVTLTHTGWETAGVICGLSRHCREMWSAALTRFSCDFVANQMAVA